MNEKDYMIETRRTAGVFDTQKEAISMLCMGLTGEAGEVVDTFKKVFYHGHKYNREEMVKELGDMYWYFMRILDETDISPEEVRIANIAKLRERYPNGFSEADSIKRVDNN